ncbi:MAG: hypothetical protein Kow00120_20260 [Anaerolineae bacterium]
MRVGIDFGTTNSAVAYYDGARLVSIQIDPRTDYILPSLIYIDRKYQSVVGYEAAQEYLRRESGRRVKWERRYLGEIEIMVAGTGGSPIVYNEAVIVMIDTAANGRLIQSIKSALRDPKYDGTYVFDRFYTIDELIAIVLSELKRGAEQRLGGACTEAIIGRPVKFSDDPDINERAEEIIYKAALRAGFTDISFELEPVGVSYLHHISSPTRHTALVFDFGGGTLDLTVVRVGGDRRPEILATRGVLVGGDDLDRRIMQSLLKYFGEGSTLDGYPFPHDILDLLLSWQTMPEVSRPQHMNTIRDLKHAASNPAAVAALETLVSENVGYKLFSEIERTKIDLSTSIISRLEFRHGPIRIREVITRIQFEAMIAEEIAQVEAGINAVMADAELKPADIDIVLRTGGSSLVPAVADLLASMFSAARVQQVEPLVSVVGGLAVAAHAEGARRAPRYAVRYERPAQPLIENIRTERGGAYGTYTMRIDAACYSDVNITVTQCPVMLSGLPAIKAADADHTAESPTFLRFDLKQPARVYVAYEASAQSRPAWLRAFTRENAFIAVKGEWVEERLLQLHSKEFPAGTVTLGGNQAEGASADVYLQYLVVVQATPAPAR